MLKISAVLCLVAGLTSARIIARSAPSDNTVVPAATPDFLGLNKSIEAFKNATVDLNTDKPLDLQCRCWQSMDFLADQMTNLTAEFSHVFSQNLSAPITHDLLHWLHNTQNSANHLIKDVWQSGQVKKALTEIRNTSIKMKDSLNSYERKSAPQDIQNDLAGKVSWYIKNINILTAGLRQYWPQNTGTY